MALNIMNDFNVTAHNINDHTVSDIITIYYVLPDILCGFTMDFEICEKFKFENKVDQKFYYSLLNDLERAWSHILRNMKKLDTHLSWFLKKQFHQKALFEDMFAGLQLMDKIPAVENILDSIAAKLAAPPAINNYSSKFEKVYEKIKNEFPTEYDTGRKHYETNMKNSYIKVDKWLRKSV
jgi:translation elongation factor EF-G